MLKDLMSIQQKPSDYKVCSHCNHLNWYENNQCISCEDKEFNTEERDVNFAILREYDFWIKEENYTEDEADNVQIEV